MKASFLVIGCFCLFAASCLLAEETLFYRVRGSLFEAQNVPANHVDITAIVFSWHPESVADAFAHHSVFETKVIWKAIPIRRTQLAGLKFEVLKAPPGFKTVVDKGHDLPKGGVFSLDLYSGGKVFIYHEFPAGYVPN